MKILLHTCCGPCSIFPTRILRENSHEIMGYFYRSNIHPFTECEKRLTTLQQYAEQIELKLIIAQEYELETFLRNTAFREADRCRYCYYERLKTTALIAKRGNFDRYSTTLLYSKFQKHELIRSIGISVGNEVGIPFHYEDFRIGWKEGVTTSKQLGMYRQQYCGCIYSEKERYIK